MLMSRWAEGSCCSKSGSWSQRMGISGQGRGLQLRLCGCRPSYCQCQERRDAESVNGKAESESGAAQSLARKQWMEALDRLLSVCNHVTCHHRIVHYCVDAQCCNNYDMQVTKQRVCQALVQFIFRSVPCVPSSGKWTKCGPALDRRKIPQHPLRQSSVQVVGVCLGCCSGPCATSPLA